MGQKANPKSLRLGITEDWDSVWFNLENYSENVLEDFNKIKYNYSSIFPSGCFSCPFPDQPSSSEYFS